MHREHLYKDAVNAIVIGQYGGNTWGEICDCLDIYGILIKNEDIFLPKMHLKNTPEMNKSDLICQNFPGRGALTRGREGTKSR